MFDEWIDRILNIVKSRTTVLALFFLFLCGVLLYRCFDLQIVHGQEYLDDFILKTERTREISGTRGRILDCNGKVLADNELAYSVRIEDEYESGMNSVKRNRLLNADVARLIELVEKNGDSVISDFQIILNEDGNFAFTVQGTALSRFRADVYGRKTIQDLKENEADATADDVMEFLAGTKKFRIGDYEIEGDTKSDFIPGKGYSKEELLKMVTIRYAMSLAGYRKYVGTIVAKDVNEKTVAVIMEHSDELPGVTIVEDTVRRYTDSVYFAHILGYTGKISSDELAAFNEEEPDRYSMSDMVGKGGMEAYMESTLQGIKGSETVVVDNLGKTLQVKERTEPAAGKDVYLTIDADLQEAAYHILEQHIAGIVSDKIINSKEYTASGNSSNKDIKIPIYDVYYAVINNSVIDISHFSAQDAGEKEKEVCEKHSAYKEKVYAALKEELTEKKTPYNKLSKEYQVYESNLVSLLNKSGIIDQQKLDIQDATYLDWAKNETISLREYLDYAINKRWIAIGSLKLEEKYVDAEETFSYLMESIFEMLDTNQEFQKKLYKYMLLNDVINGRDICILLCEQNAAEVSLEDEAALYDGKMTAYQFMMNRVRQMDITPAQLALDPCNGSVVIVDVNTGDVKAMVSYPGYDNNKMANSVDAVYYTKLLADKSGPILNYATQYKAAPGSTFKMVSATAGLMEGAVTLSTRINCVGTYTAIQPNPRCWSRGHGLLDIVGALQHSCNYFFYDVGYRLSTQNGSFDAEKGLETLAEYASMYGLAEKSGVEIAEYEPDVSDTDPVRSAIGQGSNSYTAAGIARYVAAVANQGTCYKLTLLDKTADSNLKEIEDYEPQVVDTIDMPEQYWDAIHSGMRKVVEGKSYFKDLAVKVAGKTGTAEQIKTRPNHALFVGYAPYEEPELAFATRIPFGYSSDYAAQVTRDIIRYYYGLSQEEDLITGTANEENGGVSVNEF